MVKKRVGALSGTLSSPKIAGPRKNAMLLGHYVNLYSTLCSCENITHRVHKRNLHSLQSPNPSSMRLGQSIDLGDVLGHCFKQVLD